MPSNFRCELPLVQIDHPYLHPYFDSDESNTSQANCSFEPPLNEIDHPDLRGYLHNAATY